MLKILLVLVSFCAYLTACNAAPRRADALTSSINEEKPHAIYVIRHSWHTGIVLNKSFLGEELAFLKPLFAHKTFYEFGWGHREFYRARNSSVSLYLRSALLPSATVMHIVASNAEPVVTYESDKIVTLKISAAGLEKLRKGLADSFKRNDSNAAIRLEKGLYGDSYFFEGLGTYTTFGNTCNTWTARMLKRAGVPLRTFMRLSANSVMVQVRRAASAKGSASNSQTIKPPI